MVTRSASAGILTRAYRVGLLRAPARGPTVDEGLGAPCPDHLDVLAVLEDGAERTQSEIAEYLNLSRQRVSQIENKALLRLRKHMGNQSLRSFLN